MPMVRRSAATNLGKFAATAEYTRLKVEIMSIFDDLTQDIQDSVRLLAVKGCADLVSWFTPYPLPKLFITNQTSSHMPFGTFIMCSDATSFENPDSILEIPPLPPKPLDAKPHVDSLNSIKFKAEVIDRVTGSRENHIANVMESWTVVDL
ncbi:unnamed protein product [Vicia faba]|uniref:Uncharacterized protein n=1 Tax=Vicia faba TaxID=3906 RepID=A0AAV0Z411_VICFA|nr:unnamed protein product [Vicia faba]